MTPAGSVVFSAQRWGTQADGAPAPVYPLGTVKLANGIARLSLPATATQLESVRFLMATYTGSVADQSSVAKPIETQLFNGCITPFDPGTSSPTLARTGGPVRGLAVVGSLMCLIGAACLALAHRRRQLPRAH